MTITLLAPDGVPVTARQERQAKAALYGGGSGRPLGGRSGFRVDTASNILTATSTQWTLKPCSAQIDPGFSTHQGMYGWSSDADITGALTAADSTNPRKDLVYIQVNDSSAGDGSGAVNADVKYLAGTPGPTPSAPALPARSFEVGTISVPVAGGGAPTVTLNKARFVAAGGILPVYSVPERDALLVYDGLTVRRMDLPGRPVETWDGTTSAWVLYAPSPAINGGTPTDITVMRNTWSRLYTAGPRRPRVWSTDGVTAFINGLVQFKSGTGGADICDIPAPFAPSDGTVYTYVGTVISSNGGSDTVNGAVVELGILAGKLTIVYQSKSLAVDSLLPLHGFWRISG